MTRYSTEPRDLVFVKSYGFLSFTKIISKNIGENISTKLNAKYSQKLLDRVKQSATNELKTASKRPIKNSRSNG